jgi:hypothetical protein
MTQGRVIRIVDEQRIVLNLGSADGVARGDQFGIYTPLEAIVDPVTGENLGGYRERKATVKAEIVAERFVIAGPVRLWRWKGIESLFPGFGETDSDVQSLPINKREAQPFPTGPTIRIGDQAEKLEPSVPTAPSPERLEEGDNDEVDSADPADGETEIKTEPLDPEGSGE